MKLQYIDTIYLPEYSLPYFVNGDKEGCTEEDIKNMDSWRNSFGYPIEIEIPRENNIPLFTWHPAFGLACNCYDLKIYRISA